MRRIYTLLLLCCLTANATAQLVTLNFKEMDINLLVNTIADITKKTFIVDPRVKANVTVISTQPMDDKQVYEVFLSILAVHGFSAVVNGNIIKIIPQTLAKSENMPLLAPREQQQGDGLVTQVLPVNHISAAQLVPILRPLLPQQGHLVAYPANNTLIISDTANNVNRIRQIVERMDQINNADIDVIMLQNASAPEIARILTTLNQRNLSEAAAGGASTLPSIVADERTNSILISADPETRLRMRGLISHLDTPLKATGNTQVIYLKYAQAKELVNVLKGVSENLPTTTTPNSPNPAGNLINLPPPTPNSSNNNPLLTGTSIQADESTNSLVITAAPSVLQNLQSVIRQLDVRRAQVLVEAIIAEVSSDKVRELGVQWLLDGSQQGTSPIAATNFNNVGTPVLDLATTAYQLNNSTLSSLPTFGAGSFLGLGRFNASFNFGILLQALSADTDANILSTPSLMTLDNQSAEISVGQNVPFLTGQFTNTGAGTGAVNPFQTIQREDVGIKLKIRPQINEGNAVQLEIEQEVSSLSQNTTSGFITNKRNIKTTVIVEDGSMVILGGLISEDLQQSTQKVPLLGDIPLLGNLFRAEGNQKNKRSLMVFLHPRIVRDSQTETLVSTSKYNYMQAQQLAQREKGLKWLETQEIPVLPNLDKLVTLLPNGEILTPIPPK